MLAAACCFESPPEGALEHSLDGAMYCANLKGWVTVILFDHSNSKSTCTIPCYGEYVVQPSTISLPKPCCHLVPLMRMRTLSSTHAQLRRASVLSSAHPTDPPSYRGARAFQREVPSAGLQHPLRSNPVITPEQRSAVPGAPERLAVAGAECGRTGGSTGWCGW